MLICRSSWAKIGSYVAVPEISENEFYKIAATKGHLLTLQACYLHKIFKVAPALLTSAITSSNSNSNSNLCLSNEANRTNDEVKTGPQHVSIIRGLKSEEIKETQKFLLELGNQI